MKKMISILVMVMFVMSFLPMAFAANNELQEKTKEINERFQQARERYQEAKDRYQELKARYQEAKDKIEGIKNKLRECREDNKTECQKVRKQGKEFSKTILLNMAERIIETLEKIKAKVQSNEEMSEQEIADIVAKIDVQIQNVTSAKETISGLTNESSSEEVKDAVKTIKDAWQDIKVSAKKNVARLMNAKIGGIIIKAEALEAKLAKITDKLQKSGEGVSKLNNLTEQFSAKVDAARAEWETAKQIYAGATTPGEIDEAMKQVHNHIKAAHKSLKEAQQILKEIMKEIRSKKTAESALTDVETEEAGVDIEQESPGDEEEPEVVIVTNETEESEDNESIGEEESDGSGIEINETAGAEANETA